jgi:hypothetical protein
MEDDPTAALQIMQDRLAASARRVAAVEAVTAKQLDYGWAAVERSRLLLAWFNRTSGQQGYSG